MVNVRPMLIKGQLKLVSLWFLLVLVTFEYGLLGVFDVPIEQPVYVPPNHSKSIRQQTVSTTHTNATKTSYWQYGKYQYQFDVPHSDPNINNRKNLFLIEHEPPSFIGQSRIADLFARSPRTNLQVNRSYQNIPYDVDTWVLSNKLPHATRNHDTIVLEAANGRSSVTAITLLGRHNRFIQQLNVETGHQRSVRTSNRTDPVGHPLDDLNHVSAVLVDNEIWLPCGFKNDKVNSEVSTEYARIVNVDTLQVRVGPKLPIAGGACVATSIHVLANEPPMVCSFGGTQGTHDRGTFLKETFCYDRVRHRYWSPFGNLPYGLDHGSLVVLPKSVCHPEDPARVIILNFRTKPYGDAHTELLAYDMPDHWTLSELQKPAATNDKSHWYVYYNITVGNTPQPQQVGRDASGILLADGGRHILNFGGTYHFLQQQKRRRGRFSMIRSFDVCQKEWRVIGDMGGVQTFALQTAASQTLQLALTCGGEVPLQHSNNHWCFAHKFHNGMRLVNRYPSQ